MGDKGERPIAIIPARGGSQRVPRKNIRDFFGQPILARVVQTLLDTDRFGSVVVSTDDEEIAEVARDSGAVVPQLRTESAGDYSTLHDAMSETLGWFDDLPEWGMCVLATAVLPSVTRFSEAIDLAEDSGEEVMTVLPYSTPPQLAFPLVDGRMGPRPFIGLRLPRSQDYVPLYHDAGQCYVFRTEELVARSTVVPADCRTLVLDPSEAQDIDSESDWKLAEAKFVARNSRS